MRDEPVRGSLPPAGFYGLSGLEQLRLYLNEELPATPNARLLGYRLTQMSSGTAVMSLPLSPWFEIYDGLVDLSPIAGLSVHLAAMTVAPPAMSLRTVTLSIRYLRPCTVDDESVVARGRVVHAGSTFTTSETLIEDRLGRAVAQATGCVLSEPIEPPPATIAPIAKPAEEPTYATPDPPRRRVPPSSDRQRLPLLGQFLGIDVVHLSDRRAETTMPASEWFCEPAGDVEAGSVAAHAAVTAALLIPDLVAASQRLVTFETVTSFLSRIAPDGRSLRCTGTVVRAKGGDVFVTRLESRDEEDALVCVGTGTQLARERRAKSLRRPANRVLLTVLFTDVVGSTQRATEVGDDRWRELLDEHDALVRRQLESHKGREVKTMGDGFLATFESPSSAVQCARSIRDGVERLGLQIRVGVHTGECELVGRDVAGLAVHIASRVQGAAQPGEVLVSSTVRDLIAGSGLDLVDRGRRELKGLEGEWQLFALQDDA